MKDIGSFQLIYEYSECGEESCTKKRDFDCNDHRRNSADAMLALIVFLANMLIQSAFRCENFLAIVTSNDFAEEH